MLSYENVEFGACSLVMCGKQCDIRLVIAPTASLYIGTFFKYMFINDPPCHIQNADDTLICSLASSIELLQHDSSEAMSN